MPEYSFPLAASGPGGRGSATKTRRMSDSGSGSGSGRDIASSLANLNLELDAMEDPSSSGEKGPTLLQILAATKTANGQPKSTTAALTASFSTDSNIDETDPFALIQRGLNQQAHNDLWGAADSFGRASVMLKRRSDVMLAKEAEHNKSHGHHAAHGHRGSPDGSSLHRRAKSHPVGTPGFLLHRRSDSSGGGFNLEPAERRSVRQEAAEVFKERSREYFRQARESLIAAMAIDTKASSSSESKDSTGPSDQEVQYRCIVFRRLFAPGHTKGGVPTDPDRSLYGSMPGMAASPPLSADRSASASNTPTAAANPMDGVGPTMSADSGCSTTSPSNGDKGNGDVASVETFPDDDISNTIEAEEDLRSLSRRFEELEEMAVSPQDYAPVGGDGDYHSYETSNLIDSNLEPHYSNLIDSANAPIFGVDRQGRVNVWYVPGTGGSLMGGYHYYLFVLYLHYAYEYIGLRVLPFASPSYLFCPVSRAGINVPPASSGILPPRLWDTSSSRSSSPETIRPASRPFWTVPSAEMRRLTLVSDLLPALMCC